MPQKLPTSDPIQTQQVSALTSSSPFRRFYPRLAANSVFQGHMKEAYGRKATGILKKMAKDTLSERDAEDIDLDCTIGDLAQEHGDCVDSLEGQAADEWDYFDISIVQYGPIFYIQANEFDDIGYFDSLEEAMGVAESEFSDAIQARKEYVEEHPEEAEET